MKLQLVFDEKPRRGGAEGASSRIAKALYQQGIEVSSLIYDEALIFIAEEDFFSATERLRMLHTLNPTDTDALILLAKALAARKHWQEAKHYLSIATENGAKIPKQVEDFIEQGLIRDLHNADVERRRALARDRKEIKLLKKELRKLRSNNSVLNSRTTYLTEKLNSAYYMCVTIAGISLAVVFHFMIQNSSPKTQTVTQTVPKTQIEEPIQKIAVQTKPAVVEEIVKPVIVQEKPPPEEKPQPKVEPPKPKVEEPKSPYPIVYIVKPGDSLGKISEKFYKNHRSWKKISEHNDLDPSKLRVGQKIEIPAP